MQLSESADETWHPPTAPLLTENIIVYRPADGFTGVDIFPYTVADANGATSTGLVTIEVIAPNEP